MTGTVMFDLQAAVMAAAANGGQGGVPNAAGDIPEDGVSFSDVLAFHAVQGGGTAAADEAAADAALNADSADIEETAEEGVFGEAMKLIENSDDGVKKALELLLKTVIGALKGPDDGKERKTDLFALLFDGGAGMQGSEDDLLLGAEIMNRLSLMIDDEIKASGNTDSIFAGLEEFVSKLVGTDKDDDTDENTAADILAAMLNAEPQEIETFSFMPEEFKSEAIENASETLRTFMRTVEEKFPEKLPEAEKLYSEFKAILDGRKSIARPAATEVSFSSLRISNAESQVSEIVIKTTGAAREADAETVEDADSADTVVLRDKSVSEAEPVSEPKFASVKNEDTENAEADALETNADIAALNTEPEEVFVYETAGSEAKLSAPAAEAAESRIVERISEKLFEADGKDGVDEMVIILRPKELGQVAVKLIRENGAVSVMLSAQYEEVGKLMTERAAYLGSSLANQNYDVKNIQVVEPGSAAEQMGLNFTDRGFSFASGSGQQQHRGENGGAEEIDGIDEVNADYGDTEILREARLWTTA